MKLRFVALSILFCSSIYAGGGKEPEPGPIPSHRKPAAGAKVYAPPGKWNIKSIADTKKLAGSTASEKDGVIIWDLKGGILDGKNQDGKCDQNEKNEPLFRAYAPIILKNGFVRNAKNGMYFSAKNSGVEKMTWLNICEDGIGTNKGAENLRIIDSEFINHSGNDKSIQLNEAKGAIIKGNLIYAGTTCMRVGASDVTAVSDVATVTNNRFVGCDTAIHASKITVKRSGNKFTNVNTEEKSANGAKFK